MKKIITIIKQLKPTKSKDMSKIIFDSAISLDGYMAGDNRGPQNPIGDGGVSLHTWMFKQKAFVE